MTPHLVEYVSAALVLATVVVSRLHVVIRERLMVQAANMRAAVKLGDHFYYVVDADEMHELLTQYKTDPDRIEQYQVDAALAWLKRTGAGFYCQMDGETGHVSSADLVKTVLKAVREAEK